MAEMLQLPFPMICRKITEGMTIFFVLINRNNNTTDNFDKDRLGSTTQSPIDNFTM